MDSKINIQEGDSEDGGVITVNALGEKRKS